MAGPANSTKLLSTWMYFLTYNYNQVGLGWRSLWRAGHERLLPHPPHSHHRGGTNRRLFLVSHFLPDCLPLALPAVILLCILYGVATWKDFILARIFLRSDEL